MNKVFLSVVTLLGLTWTLLSRDNDDKSGTKAMDEPEPVPEQHQAPEVPEGAKPKPRDKNGRFCKVVMK